MALPVLPNPSNFVAVALVINRSRDGPRFVFHYPPQVLPPQRSCAGGGGDDDDDDVLMSRNSKDTGFETSGSTLSAAELAQWNYDDHLITESGTQIVPWEHVAGFPTKDLENILTPARAYHKKLFHVSLDPLHCVSYPIHVPENGIWRKNKKQQQQQQQERKKGEEDAPSSADTDGQARNDGRTSVEEIQPKPAAKAAEVEDKKSSMTMFNLVFFLKPKKHEVNDLVDIMYTHIIKKINKAYKYSQQRGDFVWKESKRILALKDKAREDKRKMSSLWAEILSTSTLAASMQEIYEAISQNKIASLQLDTAEGMVAHSVQIPVPFFVSDLPDEGEERERGLWLTTANTCIGDEAADEPGFIYKNFALLLMMDEKRVIAELQNDPDETTPAMIEFVRHCKPNLSFYQVVQQSSNVLAPQQVRKFAQHFIFWRRAIAIPPLHARDMYIVSPNCDLRKLPQATAQWARQFPLSPALPNFLSELSVAPRPYKTHCPSKVHRPVYMNMLAWLMRGGWVTQLCTFAYVVVWPEVIYEVEYAQEAEDIARAKKAQNLGREPDSLESKPPSALSSTAVAALGDAPVASFGSGFLPLLGNLDSDLASSTTSAALRDLSLSHHTFSSSTRLDTSYSDSEETSPTSPTTTATTNPIITSPSTSSHPHEPSKPTPTPAEQAAEKARLQRKADKAARELAQRATDHARKPVPQQTAHPSINHARHLDFISPYIILDAQKATGKESAYLSAIERRFRARAAESRRMMSTAGATSTATSTTTTTPAAPIPATAAAATAASGGTPAGPSALRPPGTGTGTGIEGTTTTPSTTDAATTTTAATAHNNNTINTNNNTSGSNNSHPVKNWDERVADAWPLFWKYFNGRSALERIALQEEMKRKDVWNLLTSMSEYILCVRHW